MIQIQEIKNASKEDVINLLLEEKNQPFEIFVPKETMLYHSTNQDIANDYAVLAFSGQMLKNASDSFEYDYVSPSEHLSVCFTCVAKDFEELASAIFEISLWFFNDFEEEEFYLDEAYQFIDDVKKSKLEPACNDFVKDCIAYMELD
ncbi:hypothetical protein [uncultured Tenacibaculum sp.]|uniref:hypothetical protein n=1 Tax=uncultured Tenacibaculum sp. TaxID=174713 RepID=UPI0026234B4E|nr:hypothetical protein [uncultured Tenacibaculum sp.]